MVTPWVVAGPAVVGGAAVGLVVLAHEASTSAATRSTVTTGTSTNTILIEIRLLPILTGSPLFRPARWLMLLMFP